MLLFVQVILAKLFPSHGARWKEKYYEKTQVAYHVRDYKTCLHASHAFLSLGGKRLDVMILRAYAFAGVKEYEKAQQQLMSALEHYPGHADILASIAYMDSKRRDFTGAVERLTPLIEHDAPNAALLNNRGFALSMSGKYAESMVDFNLAIAFDPSSAYAYNNRGYSKMFLGDYEGAEKDINHSLALDPQNSWAYKNRGIHYLKTDRQAQACADFRYALQLGYTETYDDHVLELIQDHCL